MSRTFARVGVVGLGIMGAGIVEVFARNRLGVVAVDVDAAAVDRGRRHVEHSTRRAVQRGKLSAEDQADLLARIEFTTDLHALAAVDLVVEAVPERLEIKRSLFARLDEICPADSVLATNTSSLSVTEIAMATQRPGQVVGLHFFNPAPVMQLVEIVHSVATEPQVMRDVEAFVRSMGKVGVTVGDRAGFIANSLLFGYLNQAAAMYEAQVATREDMDAAMTLGGGLPIGPLTLLDLIGLDTAVEILDTMYRQSRDCRHAATPLLKQLVAAGRLGRKTGRGFYTYDRPGSPTLVADVSTPAPENAATGSAAGVRRIGVVGVGSLAAGIAELGRRAGYDVVVVAWIPGNAGDAGDAGEAPHPHDLDALADCDVVIDAPVGDDGPHQRARFAAIDAGLKPGALLATTTSSRPVIECAAATTRPGAVIGLHFLDAAPAGQLVEVVSTVSSTPATEAVALDLVVRLGGHPVRCRDRAGFIVDALRFPYLNDAVKMLEANYASADDIDAAMRLGCGYPIGPVAALDEIGLDVALAIERRLHLESSQAALAPAPLLEQLVTAGRLGRRTGRGVRDYGG